MRSLFCFILIFFVPVFFCCSCSPKKPEHYVAFYLELPKTAGIFEAQRAFTLPVSEKEVLVGRDPVFNIDAFSDCVVSEKVDPVLEKSFPGIFFRIKDEYAIRLRQIAANVNNSRFILVADGKPLGFCKISNTLGRKDLFFYIETLETGERAREQLESLCFTLNSYILEFREYKQNQ